MGPWTDVVVKSKDFTVFRDAYPVTEGHILLFLKNKIGNI